MNLIELNSVGCVIDENGVTEDCDVVNEYLNRTKPTTEVDYLEMKAELAYGI